MGLIPDTIIQQVLDRTDIVALINNYTPLKKAGRNFKALCPFHHEKSSSFVVNPDKQIFHCFGCGVGGNVIGFVMRQEHLEFPQALRMLADKAGIVIPEEDTPQLAKLRSLREAVLEANALTVEFYHQELLNSRSDEANTARNYLKARGVSLETVKAFQLGFSPNSWDALTKFLTGKHFDEALLVKAGLLIARDNNSGTYDRFRNRVMFPIFDIQSRCVAFGARALTDTDGAKYINSPETPVYTKGQHLFGFNVTKTVVGKLDRVVVVEGYMDMIMPYVAGVGNIAAALGTALTVEQIRLIRRYTPNITMLFDTDPAGQSAMIRSLDLLVEEGVNVNVVSLDANEDPDSFIRHHGLIKFNERLINAQSLFDYKYDWLLKQHKATSAEGKSLISQAMLSTINRYRDEVVKFELTKLLGVRLNLPMEVLTKQFQGMHKGQPVSPVTNAAQPVKAVILSKAEEMLLTLLLNDPAWVIAAKGQISPDDVENAQAKGIVSALLEVSSANHEWSISDLLNHLSDEAARSLVTRLVNSDEAQWGEKERLFQDCLGYLGKNRQRKLRQQLQEDLRRAQTDGDKEQIERITQQLNQVIKQ